jgi:hypothetical protein
MKILVGVILGFFSGFLIYLMGAMIVIGPGRASNTRAWPALVFVLLIGGWIASSWLLIRGAQSTAKVCARGFLLGAAEWLAMIFIGAVFMGRAASETAGASAPTAGGIASIITGAFSFAMAIICLTCYAITRLLAREMKPERS